MNASYLVRFDDLCPTMNMRVWDQIETILNAANIKPMVAVVPDNQDPDLAAAPADPMFWGRVRMWQTRGWTIGLHGYQHRYVTRSAGIIGRNAYSEFAGLSRPEQTGKLRAAIDIFRREGVRPDVWIAPAHSFDETTVDILYRLGIRRISDGYGLKPWTDESGMLWIPQQMAEFRAMPAGVWTVCHHCNAWSDQRIENFRRDIERFAPNITSMDAVCAQFRHRPAAVSDLVLDLSIRAARRVRSLAARGASRVGRVASATGPNARRGDDARCGPSPRSRNEAGGPVPPQPFGRPGFGPGGFVARRFR